MLAKSFMRKKLNEWCINDCPYERRVCGQVRVGSQTHFPVLAKLMTLPTTGLMSLT